MSYLRYNHTRERERDPYYADEEPFYSRPLIRRNSKRQRMDIYDDDEYDDYPHTPSKSSHSRALTIRQPSQLAKYNVFNDRDRTEAEDNHHGHRSRTVHKYYVARPSEREDDDRREFRVKVKATMSRPKSSHSEEAMSWSGDMFKRREKWEGIDWETKERERRDSFWGDEPILKERTVRYRKIKRTRTDEWKPLKGFGRY